MLGPSLAATVRIQFSTGRHSDGDGRVAIENAQRTAIDIELLGSDSPKSFAVDLRGQQSIDCSSHLSAEES
jgi:hypothetical protein